MIASGAYVTAAGDHVSAMLCRSCRRKTVPVCQPGFAERSLAKSTEQRVPRAEAYPMSMR